MPHRSLKRVRRNLVWFSILLLVWLLCSGQASAGVLSDRLSNFPAWQEKLPTQAVNGELTYPDWLAGTWIMTSTLVELQAPLAPTFKTPGFDSNQALLEHPVTCKVRFEPKMTSLTKSFLLQPRLAQEDIVADRAFNSLNLARAYLGEETVQSVKVDPKNPNRQLTILQGNRQLESIIVGHMVESPSDSDFITMEIFQQIFRSKGQPYFNEVETTTAYHYQEDQDPAIKADQVTAIYLSPQDPDFFKTANQPIALYRYHLTFIPMSPTA
ncbi:MAG: hypothetical protein F6K42_29960 [Leptolyngbya sp. SIO1D8]|nr:hypothetical protein [Leptolyngbya sp. SIO1D8]